MSAVAPFSEVVPKRRLRVLTNSSMACFRACPRQFKYRYVSLRRPRRTSEALRFGTLFHKGLNAWWEAKGDYEAKFEASAEAMRAHAGGADTDPFDLVKAEELMLGYTARWGAEGYETVAVEYQFDVPLSDPDTGAESPAFRVRGSLDVVVRRGGKLYQVEHKTTSSDISDGSDYWRKVSALDSQVSTYLAAAKASGLELDSCIYDVVRKVTLRPAKATPEESRRYTKKGCLDARQRLHDEVPEEFRLRVREDIQAKPDHYYGRAPIVRLENDAIEHAEDTWQTAEMIRHAEEKGHYPRNPGSCARWGGFCEYFDVCSGTASIDDDMRFRTAESAHEELEVKEV